MKCIRGPFTRGGGLKRGRASFFADAEDGMLTYASYATSKITAISVNAEGGVGKRRGVALKDVKKIYEGLQQDARTMERSINPLSRACHASGQGDR